MAADLEEIYREMVDEEMDSKIYIYPLCAACYDERIILGETDKIEAQEKKVLVF